GITFASEWRTGSVNQVGMQAEPESREMLRWRSIVANHFKADEREISETFHGCFKSGAPLSKYKSLLATAQSRTDRDGRKSYYWFVRGVGVRYWYYVIVDGISATIRSTTVIVDYISLNF